MSGGLNVASSFRSIPDVWRHRVSSTPGSEAWWTRTGDRWSPVTWAQADARVRILAAALLGSGLEAEERVAILSATRMEWMLADLAITSAGGASTAVFPTTGPEECAYILGDAGAVLVFADTAEQAAKLSAIRDRLPTVRQVVVFDDVPVSDDGWIRPLTAFEAAGELAAGVDPGAVDRVVDGIGPERLASLIYTSGTTGRPKGVMHSHDSWIYEAEAVDEIGFVTPADRQLLFLPLAHSFARVMAVTAIRLGIPTALEPDASRIGKSFGEVEPTFFAGVPRVFEKMAAKIQAIADTGGAMQAGGLQWALRVGRALRDAEVAGERPGGLLKIQAGLAERFVWAPVREMFGGRLRFAISGAAPLDPDVGELLAACRIPVLEGYGLSESAAASCVNRLDGLGGGWRIGTVGPPLPGCEARIADDGEILLRSRGIMRGYWNLPDETATVLDGDGWLHTGDLGELDRGHVKITGRKKDLIVTAGGKKITPALIERQLERSPLVAHAVLVGDRRPYCVALVALDPAAVAKLALERRISWSTPEVWADDPVIRGEIQRRIEEVNRALAPWEFVRRFAIVTDVPTELEGTLTASGKVRRAVMEERYAAQIAALYAAPARTGGPVAA